MVFGLGKKKIGGNEPFSEQSAYAHPSLGPPTQLVIGMREQGFTNNQIVQALQRDGYTSDQIFDAMNQADIRTSAQPMQEPYPNEQFYPQQQPQSQFMMQTPPTEERVEELTEAIIEEKWSSLKENVSKIVDWKIQTEARIAVLEQNINQLQKSFDDLHAAIFSKLGEYDSHVAEIGTDIKAMDQVFQKILPTFTQNVNELSRIVKGTKTGKKP